MALTELNSFNQYRVCISNSYLWEQSDYFESCEDFEPLSTAVLARPEKVEKSESGGNVETLIGLLTGALIVILSLIIVAVLFWKSNKFNNDKIQQTYPKTTGEWNQIFGTVDMPLF